MSNLDGAEPRTPARHGLGEPATSGARALTPPVDVGVSCGPCRFWWMTRWLLLLLFLPTGCSRTYHQRWADRETYGIIGEKAAQVPNMDRGFTIDQAHAVSLEGLPRIEQAPDFLGPGGSQELDATLLTLPQALELGVRHSRTYQNAREQLYLAALSLTQSRHDFAPIFSAGGRGTYSADTEQVVDFEPDPENPGATKPVLSDELVEQSRVSASGTVRADWLIRDVGRLSTAFTTDFLRFLSGDPRSLASSQLGATFVRPLLRNAGYQQQKENLTQAERNVLYALRDFTRFRKSFSVQLATAYYGVLGNRDAVRNNYLNLQSSRLNVERSRALAAEGRTTQADLGRIEQQVLSAESAWINAVRNYRQSLDDLKIQLGLSTDATVVLDDRELDSLTIIHPDIGVEESIEIALTARLDYHTTRDQIEDAERRVELAVNNLRPQVDFVASASLRSPEESSGFPLPDPDRYRWNAGFDLDLGIDQKPRRNLLREAYINLARAQRNLGLQADQIELQIRDSWRTLEQARRNHQISEISVSLAQRRVEEQNLLAEIGRARAQDQVDAQNDLVNSMNQRTQALVQHTIARLQFWYQMGILYIKDNGQWEELSDANSPQPR
jgi:outer membrane protein TolC